MSNETSSVKPSEHKILGLVERPGGELWRIRARHDSVSPEESGERLHQEGDSGHIFVTQYRQAS